MKTMKRFKKALASIASGKWINGKSLWSTIMVAAGCMLCSAVLNGCAPCYYAPGAQNVPLFTEKNDFNASAGVKIGTYTRGYDIQGALAITNHLGLTANYSHYGRSKDAREGKESAFKSNSGEFGLNIYKSFDKKIVLETGLGYGFSNIKTNYDLFDGTGKSSVHSWNLFIQPAFGIHRKNVEMAVSTRFRMLDFDKADFYATSWLGPEKEEALNKLKNNPVAFFVEPAFTFRVGGEDIKFQAQVGLSCNLTSSAYVDYDPLNISLGLILGIHGKEKPAAPQ